MLSLCYWLWNACLHYAAFLITMICSWFASLASIEAMSHCYSPPPSVCNGKKSPEDLVLIHFCLSMASIGFWELTLASYCEITYLLCAHENKLFQCFFLWCEENNVWMLWPNCVSFSYCRPSQKSQHSPVVSNPPHCPAPQWQLFVTYPTRHCQTTKPGVLGSLIQ